MTRGQETTLDLDTLKGEGPKFGNILFAVDVEGAILQIDGEIVDYSQPVDLQYGVHTLQVTADSYETYKKKLFVNSGEATIVIGLSGSSDSAGGSAAAGDSSGAGDAAAGDQTAGADTGAGGAGSAGSLAGSLAGSGQTGGAAGGSTNTDLSQGNVGGAELDAIVNGILDDRDSSSDYLSTILKTLAALYDKDDN